MIEIDNEVPSKLSKEVVHQSVGGVACDISIAAASIGKEARYFLKIEK